MLAILRSQTSIQMKTAEYKSKREIIRDQQLTRSQPNDITTLQHYNIATSHTRRSMFEWSMLKTSTSLSVYPYYWINFHIEKIEIPASHWEWEWEWESKCNWVENEPTGQQIKCILSKKRPVYQRNIVFTFVNPYTIYILKLTRLQNLPFESLIWISHTNRKETRLSEDGIQRW